MLARKNEGTAIKPKYFIDWIETKIVALRFHRPELLYAHHLIFWIFARLLINDAVGIANLLFEPTRQFQAACVEGDPVSAVGIEVIRAKRCPVEFDGPVCKFPP